MIELIGRNRFRIDKHIYRLGSEVRYQEAGEKLKRKERRLACRDALIRGEMPFPRLFLFRLI